MEGLFQLTPSLLAAAETHGGHGAGHPAPWGIFFYSGAVLLVIAIFIIGARMGLKNGPVFKNPLTLAAEHVYLFVENLCVSVIGGHGRKYVPLIMTLWMLIFTANAVGLLLPHTPTADWSLNLGLALIVVGYVQWEGMSGHYAEARARGKDPVSAAFIGFFKHVAHFAGPKLGLVMIPITLLIFGIELISEVIKILSLSVRLYGNINAGHTAKGALDELGGGVPLGGLILPLEFLVAIIQAFVFVLLTCVYLSLVTHHEDHEEDHHGDQHGHGHAAPVPA
jgi:F-type H+-transporting ATPase subunit a